MTTSAEEISAGKRFAFGENWSQFLEHLDEERIVQAEESLRTMLGVENLNNVRFLDIGSGSGLFSLAARRLGATVLSFDYDAQSVACTAELKRRYFSEDDQWHVEQGSVLDSAYLQGIGQWDVVYSWGVLHHTGEMWQALANVIPMVAAQGHLYIAIYNDQLQKSRHWSKIKKAYNEYPIVRPVLLVYGLFRQWTISLLVDLWHLRPFASWRNYSKVRGMSPWRDVVDWIGGWPYEVATPDAIFKFYHEKGFELTNLLTRQGPGCNEYVFRRKDHV
jgi:SAM-dependent methyltransferase